MSSKDEDFVLDLLSSTTCGDAIKMMNYEDYNSFLEHLNSHLSSEKMKDIVSVTFALSTNKISGAGKRDFRTYNNWWGDYIGTCLMEGGMSEVNRIKNERKVWLNDFINLFLKTILTFPINVVLFNPDRIIDMVYDNKITYNMFGKKCTFNELVEKYRNNTILYLLIHIEKIIILEITIAMLNTINDRLKENKNISDSVREEADELLYNLAKHSFVQINNHLNEWDINNL